MLVNFEQKLIDELRELNISMKKIVDIIDLNVRESLEEPDMHDGEERN